MNQPCRNVWPLLSFVILSTMLGCGDDRGTQPDPEPAVQGDVELPDGVAADEIWVYVEEGSAQVDEEGAFDLASSIADTTMTVALLDGDPNRPLLSLGIPGTERLSFSVSTTALSLILLDPRLATYDEQQRAEYIGLASGLAETGSLADAIEAAYLAGSAAPLREPSVVEARESAVFGVLVELAFEDDAVDGAESLLEISSSGRLEAPPGMGGHSVGQSRGQSQIVAQVTESDAVIQDLLRWWIEWEEVFPAEESDALVLRPKSSAILNWVVAVQELDPDAFSEGMHSVAQANWQESLDVLPDGYRQLRRVPGKSLAEWASFIGAFIGAVCSEIWPNPAHELQLPTDRPGIYSVRFYNGAAHSDVQLPNALSDFPDGPEMMRRGLALNVIDAAFALFDLIPGTGQHEEIVTEATLAYLEEIDMAGADGEITEEEVEEAQRLAIQEATNAYLASSIPSWAKDQAEDIGDRAANMPLLELIAGGGRVAEVLGGLLCGLTSPTCIYPLQSSLVVVGNPWDGEGEAPTAIGDLAAERTHLQEVELSWTAPDPNDDETDDCALYDVRYAVGSLDETTWASALPVAGEPLPVSAGTSQTLTVDEFEVGTTYAFGIKSADNAGNWSALSNVVLVYFDSPTDVVPPGPVTDLMVTAVSSTTVEVTWTATGDDGDQGVADRYELYARKGILGGLLGQPHPWPVPEYPQYAGETEYISISDLELETTYYVQLFVFDDASLSTSTPRVSVTMPAADDVPPAAIEDLAVATATETTLTLVWTATGDDGSVGTADSYEIRRAHEPGASWSQMAIVDQDLQPDSSGESESIVVSELEADTDYWFRMKVEDDEGNVSEESNEAHGKTSPPPDLPPAAVADLEIGSGSVTATSVSLTWTAPGEDDNEGTAAEYDIRYATNEASLLAWDNASQVSDEPLPQEAGTEESFEVSDLEPNTHYYFGLKTRDAAGQWSGLSDPVAQATTLGTDPVACFTVSPASGTTDTAFSFDASCSEDAEDPGSDLEYHWDWDGDGTYEVERLGDWTETHQFAAAGTYNVTLRVVDTDGASDIYAVEVEVGEPDTPPAVISNLAVVSAQTTKTTVTLSWTAPGDDGDEGTAALYDIRYSTSPLEVAQWTNATQAEGEPSPSQAGSSETFTVTGLQPHTTYSFAIKTQDQTGNWAGISNIPDGTTLGSPPTASFAIEPETGKEGTEFAFDASGSTDDEDELGELLFRWDWEDDGTFDTGWAGDTQEQIVFESADTYTVRLEVKDQDDLVDAATHSLTVFVDTTQPNAVLDLAVADVTSASATLSWTAPGDDGDVGMAAEYDVRYSTSQLQLAHWTNASQAEGEPEPQEAGSTETFTVTGLDPDTEYFFSLKTRDGAGNWSSMATQAEGTTAMDGPAPVFTSDVAFNPSDMTITLGQSFTVSVSVENQGADSDNGGIAVSFPQLDLSTDDSRVTSSSSGDQPGHGVYPAGQSIADQDCDPMTAEYLLAEYGDTDWVQGETNSYALTVTPRQAGTFEILVRSAMGKTGGDCEFVGALPPNGEGGHTDQQGWAVKKFTVSVNPTGSEEDFVLIPAGSFTMGSPPDEPSRGSDETQHEVTLTRSFYLQSTEVTNQQYAGMAQWAYDRDYCTATSSSLRDALDGSTQELLDLNDSDCEISFSGGVFTVDAGKEDHPVLEVTWYGAARYCDWLSLEAGYARAYQHSGDWQCNGHDPYGAQGYRLPTEAEWEYACRAGTQSPFHTGGCLDAGTEANYNGNYPYSGCPSGTYEGWTVPVGSYPGNDWGLHDMHGNLWEWCSDWYGNYGGDETDPVGPLTGGDRVIRGGSWYLDAPLCRSANRGNGAPSNSGNVIGFRPARSAF